MEDEGEIISFGGEEFHGLPMGYFDMIDPKLRDFQRFINVPEYRDIVDKGQLEEYYLYLQELAHEYEEWKKNNPKVVITPQMDHYQRRVKTILSNLLLLIHENKS